MLFWGVATNCCPRRILINSNTRIPAGADLGYEGERACETDHLRHLHGLLGAELAAASQQVTASLGATTGTELSARWERDVAVHRWSDRAAALAAARSGLCFGRLDHSGDPPTYVGRIGLTDPADGESALIDWRAPAARPFYCATPVTPLGVTRRRKFQLTGSAPDERVAAFHDEYLDAAAADAADPESAADPALLAALTAPRGSAMRDIVATIQGEQDAIIRLPLSGAVVIEGGPGTGKTAVALHRVAYLLYAHRERLARRGVLVVGPSAGFLRYVSGVLPALGESAVVFTTPGRLRHGITATALDAPPVAEVKGDLAMLEVLRRAVADRQELPAEPIPVELEDVTAEVDRDMAEAARERARATGLPHNAARAVFRDAVGRALVEQAAARIGESLEDPPDIAELLDGLTDVPDADPDAVAALSDDLHTDVRAELRTTAAFHAAVERLWPALTPEQLLADLYASPDRLAAAGGDRDIAALHRAEGSAWTVADAPLLDELAELLGPIAPARTGEGADRGYAADVLAILDSADREHGGEDADEVRASDFVNADMLASWQEHGYSGSVAARAAADRDWRYGHLVVDEAQELSPLAWHVLLRRCPTRSVTAVGDLAQRSAPAGARSWTDVLGPHLGSRWTHRTLTVNYRTPAEIMDLAATVLPDIGPGLRPPESVRRSGEQPWRRTVPGDRLADELRAAVATETAGLGRGTLAVITTDPDLLPDLAGPAVTVHTPVSAKGLEFDTVIVVDPHRIRAACPADLYVSLTRATQRLGLIEVRTP